MPPRSASNLPDPHRVLGIPKNATPDQIRTAYRRLARAVHPDVSKAPDAAARFAALAAAYEQLTDPTRSVPIRPASQPDTEHAEAVYDAFFRAEAAARGPSRPSPSQPPPPFETVPGTLDLALDLPLDPGEAARGVTLMVPTPAGPRALTIPAGTPDAREIRIPACVPIRPGRTGDLVVRIRFMPGSGASIPGPSS